FLALGDIRVIETDAMLECDNHEAAERRRAGQAEQFGKEFRRFPFVARGDNGVVETDGHSSFQSTTPLTFRRAHVFVPPQAAGTPSHAEITALENRGTQAPWSR